MDCVNPVAIFDNPFPLISPALDPLLSSQPPPGSRSQRLLTSPPHSPFDTFLAVDSKMVLDFRNITEDRSQDFSPIGQTDVHKEIASGGPFPAKESLDQFSPTVIRNVRSLNPKHSPSAPQSPLHPRRRPGRPTKSQLAMQNSGGKRPASRSLVTARRQIHNDSAMRSRARLNVALDNLWNTIPTVQRVRPTSESGPDFHTVRDISRADKVEIAVSYIRKLQKHLKSSFDEDTFV